VENAEYKRGARLIFEISPWITWHGFFTYQDRPQVCIETLQQLGSTAFVRQARKLDVSKGIQSQ